MDPEKEEREGGNGHSRYLDEIRRSKKENLKLRRFWSAKDS